jgi:hypothetical protein
MIRPTKKLHGIHWFIVESVRTRRDRVISIAAGGCGWRLARNLRLGVPKGVAKVGLRLSEWPIYKFSSAKGLRVAV